MKLFLSVCLLFSLIACAPSHPLGINDERWNTMTIAEQQQAFAQQQQQDALRQQQLQIAAHQQQDQQLSAEKARLEANIRLRLGITESEWAQITPDKRFELRDEQERIERESQATASDHVGHSDVAEATHEIADAMREHNIQELYTNSAYGTVVDCQISGGKAKFAGGGFGHTWAQFLPTHFSIAKGDNKKVFLNRQNKQKSDTAFWVGFSENQELQFCASENTDKRYKKCRLQSVSENYSTPLSIPEIVDGAKLTCHFAPGRR